MLDWWGFLNIQLMPFLWAKVDQQAQILLEQEARLSSAKNIVMTNVETASLAQ